MKSWMIMIMIKEMDNDDDVMDDMMVIRDMDFDCYG